MISAYGNRRKTQGTQFRAQDLSLDIIVLYRHLILTFRKKPLFPQMELFQITQNENFDPDPPLSP